MSTAYQTIEKEMVENLTFPDADVLQDNPQAQQERITELNRALILGNLEHTKIKIYFEDDTSKKMVETTVWGVTDHRIILKQGVVIPIQRILKIV